MVLLCVPLTEQLSGYVAAEWAHASKAQKSLSLFLVPALMWTGWQGTLALSKLPLWGCICTAVDDCEEFKDQNAFTA